jgi:kynurenine 3-monooxygenase
LNKALLDELEAMPNVKFCFNHKLVGADFRKNLAWFEKRDSSDRSRSKASTSEVEVTFDFMIGADGAHSSVRYHLMKFARMSYQQEYIDTLWCEFHIPPKPTATGEESFGLPTNYLHIWPGGSFMFIAIPSIDKSFTATLFLHQYQFTVLDKDPDNLVVPFFKKHFPGVVPDLISEDEVLHQYKTNSHLPLVSIKCHPYHYFGSAVILGDAAHAMVPFYGQGMNSGLEDVRVLYEHLDAAANSSTEARAVALEAYTAERHPDALAICDLALANYAEMSSHVLSPAYRLRKFVEETLSSYAPRLGWATQYSRISFENERYSLVKEEAKRQKGILRASAASLLLGIPAAGVLFGIWFRLKKN